ncbi:aldo/keto reductase family protein [Cladochytrium replicatum]|nr:aldo/keto reductase family protein [Cladochytrium replicatum]
MALNRTLKLSSGYIAPAFGLGTFQSKPHEVGEAVRAAIRAGYKHIDCAAIYENEAEIGEVLKQEIAAKREQYFITSKVWNTMHSRENVKKACLKTLKDLQLSYLDLYLIHWPLAFKIKGDGTQNSYIDPVTKTQVLEEIPIEETWQAMEELVDAGLVRSIGISNFSIKKTKKLLETARIKPAVNQVEMHPYLPQAELLEFCKANGILVTAYSPIGSGGKPSLLEDPVINEIAAKHGKSAAQVLLSWGIQRRTQVIPKSSKPERIAENFQDFILPDEDFERINQIHKTTSVRLFDFWKHFNVFDD